MRVTFDLSEKDLKYFRQALSKARKSAKDYEEDVIIDGARELVDEVMGVPRPPDFITERIEKLRVLIAMLADEEWRLAGQDRERVLSALAYFVDPDDLIPDKVPGIGYLDDAIMVELVVQELRHEIEAYEDFCEFRKKRPKRAPVDGLENRRVQLQTRMRRRRRRDRGSRAGGRGPAKSPFSLW